MRKELPILVEKIRRIPGIHDIALTTNGFFLAEQAVALVKAGLNRINVSLDSLDPVKFTAMVRRDYLHKVWEGLHSVENLPIRPIKINVVLIRGINDGEIEEFAKLARARPFVIRFIEFMRSAQMTAGRSIKWSRPARSSTVSMPWDLSFSRSSITAPSRPTGTGSRTDRVKSDSLAPSRNRSARRAIVSG